MREPTSRRTVLLTDLDYQDEALCYQCPRHAIVQAEFTMRNGQKTDQKLCWRCLKSAYFNLGLIESFMLKPITSVLLGTAEPDDDEDIPF